MADDDRNDDETDDRRERPRRDPDGVRIIGAQEARSAYDERGEGDEGEARPRRREPRFPVPEERRAPEGEPRPDDETGEVAPPAGPRPQVGGRLFGERPGSGAGPEREEDRPTGAVDLPHWTEPPTGEVPAVRRREESSGQHARFRDSDADWDDSDMSDLADDDAGVLPREDDDLTDDEAFEREVEARRRQVREARQTGGMPPPPRSAERRPSAPATPPSSGVRRIAPGEESREPTPPPPRPAPGGGSPAPRQPGAPAEGGAPERPTPRMAEGGLEPGMPEPPAMGPSGPTERDLPTAILTGVAMGVAALLLFNWGRGPTSFLVAAIAILATSELFVALRARGYRPAVPVGLAASGGLVLASYDRGLEGFVIVAGLSLLTTFVWFLIRAEDARPTVNIALTLFPILYVGGLAAFAGLLLAFPNGIGMLLGVVIAVVAYDVVGYFIGSRVGTRRIAPDISPNKTSEGLFAGIVASVLISLVIVRAIHPWDAGSALWLGVVVGVAAPIGDLVESMVKRDMGIKDFGSIIPGHGGLLDRFDAILFSLPPTFFLVRVLELF